METTGKNEYASLYRIAFASTIAMLVIIPVQIAVFVITGIPEGTLEWFELFNDSRLLGLFHADFFILVNNVLIAVIYLAFYHSLKRVDKGLMQLGVMLGLVGIAAYLSSNKTFELMALAGQYAAETDPAARLVIEAAGKASLAGWQGTAFDAYYVLNGLALFVISGTMFRSPLYTRATAVLGLLSAIFMIVPSTAGTVGLVFSLLSLVPWYVFGIRFAAVFRRLGREDAHG